MLHDHSHLHECTHLKTSHCSVCDVVYCLDCKKEWGVRKTPPYYYVQSSFWPTLMGTAPLVASHRH